MGLTGNNLFERTDKFCNNFLFDIRDGVVGVSGLGQKMLEFCGMLSDLLKEFWVKRTNLNVNGVMQSLGSSLNLKSCKGN